MDVPGMLSHLKSLIAFDTQNPPRSLDVDSPVFSWFIDVLGPDFQIDLIDHGLGRISMLAVRGQPGLLFNVHLDTVPVIAGSVFPALEMTLDKNRVYGRGSCDIKGAAACLLQVAGATDEPMALLFTSDEEGASGCCVAEFIGSERSKAERVHVHPQKSEDQVPAAARAQRVDPPRADPEAGRGRQDRRGPLGLQPAQGAHPLQGEERQGGPDRGVRRQDG